MVLRGRVRVKPRHGTAGQRSGTEPPHHHPFDCPHKPRSAPLDDWPKDMPELLPFLPLVYLAWADGMLSASEFEAIRYRVSSQSWLIP